MTTDLIDECDWCRGPCHVGMVRWPRLFRKDLLLCLYCLDAFLTNNRVLKAFRKNGCKV